MGLTKSSHFKHFLVLHPVVCSIYDIVLYTMPFNIPYSPSQTETSEMFRTHWNYIKCINNLLADLEIEINIDTRSQLDPSRIIKFSRLAELTKVSIQSEIRASEQVSDYASVVAPWIPVKCYYRLYYLEAIFLYLLTGELSGFQNGGHTKVRKSLIQKIENNVITLNNGFDSLLSEISVWELATQFRATSGANIGSDYFLNQDCHKSIRKKIAEYIKIGWMQQRKISNFRTLNARNLRDTELFPKKFMIFDYFYWMRIKANYRDIDFLDFENDVRPIDSFEYIKEYVEATEKYADALLNAIESIKIQRGII